jgi:hypothetical protein
MSEQVLYPALPGYVGPNSGVLGFCHHDLAWEWSHSFSERVKYVRENKRSGEIAIRKRHMVYLCPEALAAVGVPSEVRAEGTRLWAEGNRLWDEGTRLRAEGTRLWAEGNRLWDEGTRLLAEGTRLWAEGNRLWDEGTRLRAEGNRLLRPHTEAIAALAVSLVPDCRWDGQEIRFS